MKISQKWVQNSLLINQEYKEIIQTGHHGGNLVEIMKY